MKQEYIIVHVPPGVKPGTILNVVATLDTYDEVMDHYDSDG